MAQSLLATDGYKFSMAEAGWPLRPEVFYYSHRKGGAQLLPVEISRYIEGLKPATSADDLPATRSTPELLTAREVDLGDGLPVRRLLPKRWR